MTSHFYFRYDVFGPLRGTNSTIACETTYDIRVLSSCISKVKECMQGVFHHVFLARCNTRATGYTPPYVILPRFSSPRSRLLVRLDLTRRQSMHHMNLESKEIVF